MSDENPADDSATVEGQAPTTPQEAPETFDRAYVEELRKEAAANRIALKKFQDAQITAEDERLKKQNEWEQIAENRQTTIDALEPFKAKYEAVLTGMEDRNKSVIDSLPDDMKPLVPDYDDPAKLASWLDANAAMLNAKPLVPTLNGGAGNGAPRGKKTVLSDAQIRQANKMSISVEDYAKALGGG